MSVVDESDSLRSVGTWRDQPDVSMMANKHKSVSAVKSYLISRFPDCAVDDRFDFDTRGQVFTIERGARVLVVRVSHEFLDDVDPSEIGKLLLAWNLDEALHTTSDVLVTRAGLRPSRDR